MCSIMIKEYLSLVGKPFLKNVFGGLIKELVASDVNLEVLSLMTAVAENVSD